MPWSRLDLADRSFFAALLAGLVVVVTLGPLERRIELAHINDFSGVWAGARAVLGGIDPYAAGWPDHARALEAQVPNTAVFGYMPWVLLALLPFGAITLEPAGWLWMVVSLAAGAFGVRALLRTFIPGRAGLHAAAAGALLLSQPAVHSLVLGQWSFLLLGATAAAVTALRSRGGARAAAAAVWLAKPHLFLLAGPGLIREALARGDHGRRTCAIAVSTSAATVLLGWLLFPQWLGAFVTHVAPVRLERSASLSSALADLLGPAGGVAAVVAVIGMAAAAFAFRAGTDEALAVWLALSVAAAPYLWSYDHLLLLAPLVIATGALGRRDRRAAGRLLIAGVAVLVIVSTALYGLAVARHRESFSAVVPLLFYVAIVRSLWPSRSGAAVV